MPDNNLIADKSTVSAKTTKPKRCAQCGHMNPFNKTTCRKCGAELEETKAAIRCVVCGEDVMPDDVKCPTCGLPIEEVRARSQFSH